MILTRENTLFMIALYIILPILISYAARIFILHYKGKKSRLHEVILNYDVNNDYTYQLNATLESIEFSYTRDVLMITENFSKIIISTLY